MTVTDASGPAAGAAPGRTPPAADRRRYRRLIDIRIGAIAPTIFVALHGLAFVLVRPDVNDLWAARARASAAEHGVGLTYWFGWFSGGSTPGNYSIMTPYLCAWIGTETVGALSAVLATALITALVRGTHYPIPAAWAGSVAVLTNLWSGRIAFLLGTAIGVAALLAVRQRRRAPTVGLTVLSMMASPVSGAFIALGLSGTFLTTRTRAYRPIIAYAVVAVALTGLAVVAAFGAPGVEPFNPWWVFEAACGLALLWLAWPPDHVRTTLWVSAIGLLLIWLIPNGLGSNYTRFVYACLPVLVLATSTMRRKFAIAAVVPALIMGVVGTSIDLFNATAPVSSPSYYQPLAKQLKTIDGLRSYRLEVVNHGAHTGDDTLVKLVMLARGWETQTDHELNQPLLEDPLDPVTYKVWLDNNAVGYVALPTTHVEKFPEYTLVSKHRPDYLHLIWRNADWKLFRVEHPTPIVAPPGSILAHDQKSMTVTVPCRCTLSMRVHWSKYLTATLQARDEHGELVDAPSGVSAEARDDGSGWTKLHVPQPGTYVLRGSITGLLG